MKIRKQILSGSLTVLYAAFVLVSGCSVDTMDSDINAIRVLNTEYVESWLDDDSSGVLGTLHNDAVILPHNQPSFEGKNNIRTFWWPPNSPSTILSYYDVEIDEIIVSGDIGYTRGQHLIGWDYDGQSYTSKGKFIRISRKDTNGVWRYSRLIWNDTP